MCGYHLPSGRKIMGCFAGLPEFTTLTLDPGPIVYLNIMGRPVIVLNTLKAASDLLDKRPAIYSDRPQNIVASQILTGSLFMPFIRPGLIWRKMHQATRDCLAKTACHKFHPYQEKEAILLVESLLNDSHRWEKHLQRSTSSMIVSFLYDIPRLSSVEDVSISRINSFVERIVRAAKPGAHLVELLPWMQYLPLWAAPWKKHGLKSYQEDSEMFKKLFSVAKQRAVEGKSSSSFAAFLVLFEEKYALDEEESAWLLATMYAAGAETTSSVLFWFFLAMILHPDVQSRAQAEIDDVVVPLSKRFCVGFRWILSASSFLSPLFLLTNSCTLLPVGLPHMSSQDDYYEGYFIPKGSICIANVWAIHRDRAVYGDDAERFDPMRHLDSTGRPVPPVQRTKGENHVTFGFGTRVCPGRHVANNTLFINIASVLWGLEIRPATDKNGSPMIPDPNDMVITGLTMQVNLDLFTSTTDSETISSRPAPFLIDVTARSQDMLTILEDTKELHAGI
ncbi:Cytochrome P450 [Mycena venus]|uniref:Cytochrome P450 n=1 Tax=Mycena venus TaxID=2733690 RepID=A0A8H6TWT8_9AGAR|nr:Cytochrome P450 [Mycena venus]